MRKLTKILAMLLVGVMLVAIVPFGSSAASSIDLDQKAGLSIHYGSGNIVLNGAELSIYRVADLDQDLNYIATKDFSEYPVEWPGNGDDEENFEALASTLQGYVLMDQITPVTTVKTDKDGNAECDDLTVGLYLILGTRFVQDDLIFTVSPALITLPGIDTENNKWNYHLNVDVKFIFEENKTHDDEFSIKVMKVWEDKGAEAKRPESITVKLLANGEEYATAELNAENNWRYSWKHLPRYDAANHPIQWNIVEINVRKYYKVKIEQEGITYLIKNTYTPPQTPPEDNPPKDNPPKDNPPKEVPQTGLLWWPVAALVLLGAVFIIIGAVRRKGQK